MASDSMMSEMKRVKSEMNMTPMIDVVFQLIIFFMLVTEMTRSSLEVLTLPIAENSRPDKDPPRERLVLNVAWKADERKKPVEARDAEGYEYKIQGSLIRRDQLLDRLRRHANLKLDPAGISEMPVLIRCDIEIQYSAVLKALVECMNAKIWKIELAISEKKKK